MEVEINCNLYLHGQMLSLPYIYLLPFIAFTSIDKQYSVLLDLISISADLYRP